MKIVFLILFVFQNEKTVFKNCERTNPIYFNASFNLVAKKEENERSLHHPVKLVGHVISGCCKIGWQRWEDIIIIYLLFPICTTSYNTEKDCL